MKIFSLENSILQDTLKLVEFLVFYSKYINLLIFRFYNMGYVSIYKKVGMKEFRNVATETLFDSKVKENAAIVTIPGDIHVEKEFLNLL